MCSKTFGPARDPAITTRCHITALSSLQTLFGDMTDDEDRNARRLGTLTEDYSAFADLILLAVTSAQFVQMLPV